MFTIRIEPAGITVPANPGETVSDAVDAAGWYWPNVCGGIARCAVCAFRSGGEGLAPMTERERACLETHLGDEAMHWRLGCQARVVGDICVSRPGLARVPWGPGRDG